MEKNFKLYLCILILKVFFILDYKLFLKINIKDNKLRPTTLQWGS